MQTVSRSNFTTVKTEGAILPADLLQRIADGDLDGLQPESYHLAPNERPNEAINRAWNRCLGVWRAFNEQRRELPATDTGTSLTRERWLLILFQELGYGRLSFQRRIELPDGTAYPISHLWERTPIHLVSFQQALDHRDPTIKRSPHSLMQEFLNRTDDSLWGFVSNGLALRVLRDNASLTRAAYLEFDLEMMMTGEIYADFSLLWLVCHQSRVEIGSQPDAPALPSNCWLEKWSQEAAELGTRALDALRDGVQEAIGALGRGFLAHPANGELRQKLSSGELTILSYYRQLLRLVYRLIFLFVAEDRDLLLLPDSDTLARQRYTAHYSVSSLRRLAETRRGGPHPDLYRTLRRVFWLLREGYPPLGLPALGSFLFSDRATPALDEADLANTDLLNAIRALAFTIEGLVLRPVDYKNLGSEELGSVYESLLELHPQLNIAAASFELATAAGSERKTTGSYYTPTSLINSLLDSALEPVVKDRLAGKEDPAEAEQALLNIRVVDPAAGSGHFLIAAANRLAAHLARVRTGDDEPSPAARRDALRDVVRRCIHGVDINEMAVELCKVALWMETLDPGKPLSFLEANIQCGNSLIGTTPALLKKGIPDEAFSPITGDDRDYCSEWKARNKKERGQVVMDLDPQPWERLGDLAAAMAALDRMEGDTLAGVQAQESRYAELVRSTPYLYSRFWADAWCAAFVWPKKPEHQGGYAYPITEAVFRKIEHNPHDVAVWMKEEVEHLQDGYQFFHWHLAFPDVFIVPPRGEGADNEQTGWNGGFDVVLGNPPWDQIQFREQEFFAVRDPDIALAATGAIRKKLIEKLRKTNQDLFRLYETARDIVDRTRHFVQASGNFPTTARGRMNTFGLFGELSRSIENVKGQVGIIVPSGIATDDTTKYFFQNLIEGSELVSLYDFENRAGLFPAVDSRMKFCLLTLTGTAEPVSVGAKFIFFAHQVSDLKDNSREFTLSSEEIFLLNPNTGTCPIFRSRRDAVITKNIYKKVPILVKEDSLDDPTTWGITTKPGLFNMTGASHLFRTKTQLENDGWNIKGNIFYSGSKRFVPLYEGKMFNFYDHRFAHVVVSETATLRQGQPELLSIEDHLSSQVYSIPRYWVSEDDVDKQLEGEWKHKWIAGWKEVTSSTNERTLIPGIFPRYGIGHKIPIFLPSAPHDFLTPFLVSCLGSFVCDYIARQKLGGVSLTPFTFKQLPVFVPSTFRESCKWYPGPLYHWLSNYILELSYTAWDLQAFAQDYGYLGPPFRWDEERRFLLRCELDAAYFHMYGIERDDVDYIMETFPIVKRKDETAHGEYWTKRVILETYDELAEAIRTGHPYRTRLNPPPADLRVAHPWDPAYGPPPEPGQEWVEIKAAPAAEPAKKAAVAEKKAGYTTKESPVFQQTVEAEPLVLSHPEPVRDKKSKQLKPARVAQETFLEVMPAPAGPRAARLKRAMALRDDPSPIATRELVAFMADEDDNIRWLAGSSLLHRADADTVAALVAFLKGAEPERVEVMRPEALRILDLLADTAADEAVRQAASEALSTFES